MMRVDDLVAAIAALQRSDLEDWIREELIVPQEEAGEQLFSEMEYARVRLISTLQYELEIDRGHPTGRSFADRPALRHPAKLLSLTTAVIAQDQAVQEAIVAALSPGDNFDRHRPTLMHCISRTGG